MTRSIRSCLGVLVVLIGLLAGQANALGQFGHRHCGVGYSGVGFGGFGVTGYRGVNVGITSCYSPFTTYSWNTCYRPVGFSPYYCGVPTYSNWYVGSFGYGPTYGWGGFCDSPLYYGSPVIYLPAYYAPTIYSPIVVRRPIRVTPKPALGAPTITAAEIDRRLELERNARYTPVDIANHSKAYRYISLGDESMRAGRYSEAVRRYRQAEDAAPQMGEIFRRKGHAYIANGQYRLASVAMKRGFSLDRNIARDGFTLDRIYAENESGKSEHIDKLAEASMKEPGNSDLYYLLGLMLHYDGKADRAAPFFAHARANIHTTTPKSLEHLAIFAAPVEPRLPELPAAPAERKEESLVNVEKFDEI